MGRITASFRASLAHSSPITSPHLTFGFSFNMAFCKMPFNLSGVSEALERDVEVDEFDLEKMEKENTLVGLQNQSEIYGV